MSARSKRPGKAANKSIPTGLTPVMTLEGHQPHVFTSPDGRHREIKHISYISYFPNGKKMISGSWDKTIRQWDLGEGTEIDEAREVCENRIHAVGVSRDGRWVVTAAGWQLKVCEVETGIVRTFNDGSSNFISVWSIDISGDSTLLAGMSFDSAWIWSLDTGKPVAGPFKFSDDVTLRFSENSRKLAVSSCGAQCLQVWDVQTQKLDVTTGKSTPSHPGGSAPVFWTTKDKSIVAAFSFTDNLRHSPTTIYEFDSSTLETVGDSFEGHTFAITRLALSFDCALLVSASYDDTIKLWSFESRQLLASFDVHGPIALILSPDSRQLAYTTWDELNIYICNIPPNILASVGLAEEEQPSHGTSKPERPHLANMLNSDATRRRKPVILPVVSPFLRPPRPTPTRNTHFLRFLHKLLPSSRADAVRLICADSLRNPLDFPATAPLPRSHINSRPTPAPPTTQSSAIDTSTTFISHLHRLLTWRPGQADHALPAIVDVPLAPGKLRHAAAGAPAPDDDMIRDEGYSPPPSPNPNSRQPPTVGRISNGEHGSGRLCFCL